MLPGIVFFLVITLLLGLLNWRGYRWLVKSFGLGKVLARVLAAVLVGSWLCVVAGRFASYAGQDLPEGIFVAAFAVELAVLISVGLLLPLDLVRGVVRSTAKIWRGRELTAGARAPVSTAPAEAESQPNSPNVVLGAPGTPLTTRREFAVQVAVGSAFLVGGGSAVYGALVGRHDYVVEEVPVKLAGLSRGFDGFSIVQLSDLHIGQFVHDAELAAAEALVRKARPDLIVLTGDLVDHDPRFAERLGRFTRRLEPLARHGVAAVSGNHDYYAGIDPVVDALRRGGARVLRNEAVVLGDPGAGIALLGVDDVRAPQFGEGGPDVTRAVDALPVLAGRIAPARDLPRVLLCHNPVYFARAQGQVGLQLSGHTHGGQVNPLVRPADWVLRHGWIAGLYEARDSRLYVNRGFGTAGPPARVGAPPEVTRIVLTV